MKLQNHNNKVIIPVIVWGTAAGVWGTCNCVAASGAAAEMMNYSMATAIINPQITHALQNLTHAECVISHRQIEDTVNGSYQEK